MKNISKVTFKEIKTKLLNSNIEVKSDIDEDDCFFSFNSINNATQNQITFFSSKSNVNLLKNTKAKACIINNDFVKYLPNKTMPIIVEDTYKAFAILSNLFSTNIESNGVISSLSSIDSDSQIEDNVQIDQFVVIRENCKIGGNVIIESNCVIGPNVTIGSNTIVKANSHLLECNLGANCIVKSGAIIGGTGFGFDPKSKDRINHIGNVIIQDNCNIGSNTTIDRAVFDSTIISKNSFIDNLVQIAHNVIIGEEAIVAAQTGIAGSTKIGKNVLIGGQVGISGHLIIGDNVKIAAKSGVTKNISDNSVIAGFPAVDIKKWKLSNIKLNKL